MASMLRLALWSALVAHPVLLLIVFASGVAGLMEILRRRRIHRLLSRGNMQRKWREQFPQSHQEDVIRFLTLFADCFGLPSRSVFRLSPDDRLMDIYRAINPPQISCDGLEFESLALKLEKLYHIDLLVTFHQELTLGQLFGRLRYHHTDSSSL